METNGCSEVHKGADLRRQDDPLVRVMALHGETIGRLENQLHAALVRAEFMANTVNCLEHTLQSEQVTSAGRAERAEFHAIAAETVRTQRDVLVALVISSQRDGSPEAANLALQENQSLAYDLAVKILEERIAAKGDESAG